MASRTLIRRFRHVKQPVFVRRLISWKHYEPTETATAVSLRCSRNHGFDQATHLFRTTESWVMWRYRISLTDLVYWELVRILRRDWHVAMRQQVRDGGGMRHRRGHVHCLRRLVRLGMWLMLVLQVVWQVPLHVIPLRQLLLLLLLLRRRRQLLLCLLGQRIKTLDARQRNRRAGARPVCIGRRLAGRVDVAS